jgi:hypothetical protein
MARLRNRLSYQQDLFLLCELISSHLSLLPVMLRLLVPD